MDLPLSEQPHLLRAPHCHWHGNVSSQLDPNPLQGLTGRPAPAACCGAFQRTQAVLREALRAGEGRKAAAALTLFTEISISVMAVGT